jgi:hypothetical protein
VDGHLAGHWLGVIISVLFALLPLINIRNISPLNTLRMSFEETATKRDPFRWLVYLLVVLFVVGFSYLQLNDWIGSRSVYRRHFSRLPYPNGYCLAAYPFYPRAYHEQLELHLAAGLCQLVPAK